MSLSAAVLRTIPVAPFVALWLALPCAITERAALAVCRVVFP